MRDSPHPGGYNVDTAELRSGRSAAAARLVWDQEVGGSIPPAPTRLTFNCAGKVDSDQPFARLTATGRSPGLLSAFPQLGEVALFRGLYRPVWCLGTPRALFPCFVVVQAPLRRFRGQGVAPCDTDALAQAPHRASVGACASPTACSTVLLASASKLRMTRIGFYGAHAARRYRACLPVSDRP